MKIGKIEIEDYLVIVIMAFITAILITIFQPTTNPLAFCLFLCGIFYAFIIKGFQYLWGK